MKCKKCNSQLLPQKRVCPSCHSVQSPWFSRIVPWFLGILVITFLIVTIFSSYETDKKSKETNDLIIGLIVMIPVTLILILIAIKLFRGSKTAWKAWSILLGLCSFILIMGSFFGPQENYYRVSLVVTVGLLVWTFSSPVRWWYNIGKKQIVSQSSSTLTRNTLKVPYCSPACEELAAKTLTVAWLEKQEGPCTFCMKPVVYGQGHPTQMFPYRNQKAFLCSDCVSKAEAFMSKVHECCLCGKQI